MANTRKTILDKLVTALEGVATVKTATRILLTPEMARKAQPYVGMVTTTEEEIVEDATHVRFEVDVDLILLVKGRSIEEMLDGVKNLLYTSSTATTIGAMQISIIGQEEVALVGDDTFSSTRIATTITYVAIKGAF